MANKLIVCSFDRDSMGGFITICNGVPFNRPEHYSKTIAVTREAFIEACKDRILFNDILGIDIRTGWQNALSEALKPYYEMKENFDPVTALKASSELDVALRGEDAVKEDIEKLEKANDELDKEIAKAKKKSVKSKKKETKDDKKSTERTDNGSADAECPKGDGVSAD